jgi:hypothetical protein
MLERDKECVERALVVAPRCFQALAEYPQYRWASAAGDRDPAAQPFKLYDDVMDATRYPAQRGCPPTLRQLDQRLAGGLRRDERAGERARLRSDRAMSI